MDVPVDQELRRELLDQLHQGLEPLMGRVVLVAHAERWSVREQHVDAAAAAQSPSHGPAPQPASPPAHLLLRVLVRPLPVPHAPAEAGHPEAGHVLDPLVHVRAAERADRIAVKETRKYLRGRTRESMIGELLAGVRAARVPTSDIPIYETETEALRAELTLNPGSGRADGARVVVLMCHEEREEVFRLLASLGGRPVDVASELTELVPRLQQRPRR